MSFDVKREIAKILNDVIDGVIKESLKKGKHHTGKFCDNRIACPNRESPQYDLSISSSGL